MKDLNGKQVNIGDTVLIPIDGEHMYEEQICLEYTVIPALLSREGEITPYIQDNVYLLEE
jgi:hypothetical protein